MTASSASQSSDAEISKGSSPASNTTTEIAFLIHSPHTLNQNLPPDVDNKSFARQRRRRTSPADQKILEEEFQKNPRPDKATRVDIVSRVSLGEKEVQIWFQNRRQNSRKKSRLSESSVSDDGNNQSFMSDMSTTTVAASESVTSSKNDELRLSQTTVEAISGQVNTSTLESSSQSLEPSSQGSITTGYVANRRTLTDRALEEDEEPLHLLIGIPQPSRQPRTLERSQSSSLRLSMTGDGQAKVVDRGVNSPVKPTPAQPRSVGLRRSYSAAGLHERPKLTSQPSSRKAPRMTGRSRDSRTWEFWCDSDARNTLVDIAEKETSGSAAEAIGLIRSKSNRALKSNATKLNSPYAGHTSVNSDGGKKARPPLRKSLTSAGIISSSTQKSKNKTVDEEDFEHLNEESDKENHNPSGRAIGKSGPFIKSSIKILGENDNIKSQSSSLGSLMSKERNHRISGCGAVLDPEVADFMRGSKSASPVREEEVLHSAQALLHLSQGNWA